MAQRRRGFEVVGDMLGEDAPNGAAMVPVGPPPDWRQGQLAPGVMMPDEGLVPLPLSALQGQAPGVPGPGIFSATVTNITFEGKQQKPYRAERFLTNPLRDAGDTGTATGKLYCQIYVGTDLQQATTAFFDLELIASPVSFGTRLTCTQAPPGVVTSVPITIFPAPTADGTVLTSVLVLGRIIH